MISLLFVLGCESQPARTRVEAPQQTAAPAVKVAQVIFMRSSVVANGVDAALYEVKNGDISFIGVIANDTKIAHTTTPGKHTFMVVSETADFMEADLVNGKSYYSVVVPKMGVWTARFSLWPVQRDDKAQYPIDSPTVRSWLSGTKAVTSSADSVALSSERKQLARDKYNQYWSQWQAKSAQERARQSLSQVDGI